MSAKVSYKLPSPAVLPDLSDDNVFAGQLAAAIARGQQTRRTRILYWIHQLFPWL